MPLGAIGFAIVLSVLTPLERRGEAIYRGGSDDVRASLDAWTTTVPAASLPCASCHGNDGRGRAEGGATPSDITAASLRRRYQVTTPSGRTHGPYTERTLKRAIEQGIDPAGNRLSSVMPRYKMPKRDLDALIAFLGKLGSIADPGVTDAKVRLGVILPPRDTMPQLATATRALVTSWAASVNEKGGVFGRRLEPLFLESSGSPAERAAQLRAFLTKEPVFALAASFTEGAERELADVAEESEVPLITSVASNPRSSLAPGRYVRELLPGLVEQSKGLIGLAARQPSKHERAAVVVGDSRLADFSSPPGDLRLADVRNAALEELRANGWTTVDSLTVDQLDAKRPDTIVILDSAAAARTLAMLRTGDWKPLLLIPASFAGAVFAAPPPTRTFVSVPSLPNDETAEGRALFERLAPAPTNRAMQLATLASAVLTLDTLSRTGRVLTREKFLDTLDATSRFQTGLGPMLTFRRDRHLGSTGSHILVFTPGEETKTVWVDAGR